MTDTIKTWEAAPESNIAATAGAFERLTILTTYSTIAMVGLSLVVAGQFDKGAGDPEGLARLFPNGKGHTVPGCDHFSAIPHGLTKAAVFDFLDGMLDDDFPPFE